MARYIISLASVLILSITVVQRAESQEDVERTLNRAQALYYEAHFKDSVDLLLPVDAALRQKPTPMDLTISVKLQLALGYIGQNQTEEAKSVLTEVCMLDPEYALDSNQFAPKVIALYDDVKAKQKQTRCETFCKEVDRLSKAGDAQGLLNMSRQVTPGCSCSATQDAAEILFKQGVEAYKQESFAPALEKLRAALVFRPDHDLAIQYADLAETKIKLSVERMVLDWRRSFETHDFSQASSIYRALESANVDKRSDPSLVQMRAEYRKVVAARVDTWNQQGCSTKTAASLEALRQQNAELLPDAGIAADMVSKLAPCAPALPPVPTPVAKPSSPAPLGCLQMESTLAMVRLKSRVNPEIPPNRLPAGNAVEIRVKVRIDENGDVTVLNVEGSNSYIHSVMKDTLAKWKFLPAVIDDRRRCVETELPVKLSRS